MCCCFLLFLSLHQFLAPPRYLSYLVLLRCYYFLLFLSLHQFLAPLRYWSYLVLLRCCCFLLFLSLHQFLAPPRLELFGSVEVLLFPSFSVSSSVFGSSSVLVSYYAVFEMSLLVSSFVSS